GYGYIAQMTSAAYAAYQTVSDGWRLSVGTELLGWKMKGNYGNIFSTRENFNLTTGSVTIINGVTDISSYVKKNVHSRYELLAQKLQVQMSKENKNLTHQINIEGIINEGTGQFTQVASGANYLFDEHNASLQYLLSLKRENTIKTELGLNTGANHFTKKDFLASHFYENTTANISICAAQYIYVNNQHIKISAKPGLTL